MSNAFCTARSPLALAIATGLAAQRDSGGKARGGRIGCGMPNAELAVTPAAAPAALCRNSRRDKDSGMRRVLATRLAAVNLLSFPPRGTFARGASVQRAGQPRAAARRDPSRVARPELRSHRRGRWVDRRLVRNAPGTAATVSTAAHHRIRA